MNISQKIKKHYRYLVKDVPRVRIDKRYRMERHGSTYGGWNIIKDSLDSNSIVYSFGIGKDISFDRSINAKYGCKVFGFDPTPEVIEWLGSLDDLSFFVYKATALGVIDGTEKFYFPKNESNISMSTLSGNFNETKHIEVEIARLSTLMSELGHTRIDLLKMDIEGSEYEVIPEILSQNLVISQLLIEMHHFFDSFSGNDSKNLIDQLRSAGFELTSISDSLCEFSFKNSSQ